MLVAINGVVKINNHEFVGEEKGEIKSIIKKLKKLETVEVEVFITSVKILPVTLVGVENET